METAPFIRRFLAAIIDYIVLVVIAVIIALLFGLNVKSALFLQFREISQEPRTLATISQFAEVPFWIFVLIFVLYFILMETTRGATLGKILLRIEVVKEEGGGIGLREALIRTFFRFLDGLPYFYAPLYIIGLISYLLSPTRQRLGDHVAQTLVVSKK